MRAAAAFALYALLPIGYGTAVPIAAIGFILFAEAVWITSRIRPLASVAYQARLRAITTTTLTIGGAVGNLWGGLVVDWAGVLTLTGGAIVLAVVSGSVLIGRGRIKQ